jgi:hypothetical protein
MDNAANSLMTALIDAGNIDTVYRDVYLDRARTFLAPVLSLEEFHCLEQHPAALAALPAAIAHALETANWSLVKELSQRAQLLKRTLDDKAALLQTAQSVYDVRDIRLDPFSPGLQSFTRIPARDWPTLRTRASELLGTLERADVAWSDFYAARRRAFQARRETTSDTFQPDAATSSPTDALEAARQALKAGDMNRLAALADALSAAGSQSGSSSSHAASAGSAAAAGEPGQDLQPVAHPARRWPARGTWGWRRVTWNPGWNSPRFASTPGRPCRTSGETAAPLSCSCRPERPRLSGTDSRSS